MGEVNLHTFVMAASQSMEELGLNVYNSSLLICTGTIQTHRGRSRPLGITINSRCCRFEKNAGPSPHFARYLIVTTSTSRGTRTRWTSIGAEVLSRNRRIFE